MEGNMFKTCLALLVVIAVLFILGSSGCGKKSVNPKDIDGEIVGTWNWVKTYGGIGGQLITPDSVGYTKQYVFSSDNMYYTYRNMTQHTGTGWYGLGDSVDCMGVKTDALFLEIGDPIQLQGLAFPNSDTMIIYDCCIDCYSHTYVRLK